MVGELHKTGSARVDKKRRVGNVLERTPPRSRLTELAAQLLQRSFACRLIENDQSSLLIALLSPPAEEIIKSLAKILKCQFNGVRIGERLLLNCACEKAGCVVTYRRNFENGFQNPAGIINR